MPDDGGRTPFGHTLGHTQADANVCRSGTRLVRLMAVRCFAWDDAKTLLEQRIKLIAIGLEVDLAACSSSDEASSPPIPTSPTLPAPPTQPAYGVRGLTRFLVDATPLVGPRLQSPLGDFRLVTNRTTKLAAGGAQLITTSVLSVAIRNAFRDRRVRSQLYE